LEKYLWNEAVLNNFNDFDSERDFGIYQIYGSHPVYGDDTLLYIGKVAQKTFATMMKRHYDFDVHNLTRIYFGYFCEIDGLDSKQGENAITWEDVFRSATILKLLLSPFLSMTSPTT
jgi:hypothetical protein